MAVLPLLASTIVSPGSSWPLASASSTMASTMRSLMLPLGFWPSSFAKIRMPGLGEKRGSSISGVLPIRLRRVWGCVLSIIEPLIRDLPIRELPLSLGTLELPHERYQGCDAFLGESVIN